MALTSAEIKQRNIAFHDTVESERFDRIFGEYQDAAGLAQFKARYELIFGGLPSGERVLDLGCGTGFLLLSLAALDCVKEGHGADISVGMLSKCRRKASELGHQFRLANTDAERLPYREATFDLIVGHAFLHHLPDMAAALSEARRCLRPGGQCIIFGEEHTQGARLCRLPGRLLWGLPRAFYRTLRKARAQSHAHMEAPDLVIESPQQIYEAARKAGFDEVRLIPCDFTSAMFASLAHPLLGRLGRRFTLIAKGIELKLLWLDQKLLARWLPANWFCGVSVIMQKGTLCGSAGASPSHE